MSPKQAAAGSDRRFLLLYALAWAGAAIAYTPLLTILLPVRVDLLAGTDNVRWLAATTFLGAIAASLANILFGWLSDVTGHRRLWVATGLLLSSGILCLFPHIERLGPLILLILLWQMALNMMLGPLAAWAGDCVPDRQKGRLGGLLAFAPASGALAGALVTVPGLADPPWRFAMVGMMAMACVLPLLLLGPSGAVATRRLQGAAIAPLPWLRAMITRMWCARLLVQIAEAALFAYLYFWFQTIDTRFDDAITARILTLVLFLAAPCALIAGRWADRRDRPIAPLCIAALLAAIGLTAMALARGPVAAIAGFMLFGLSTNIFLALHSAQTLRVLPDDGRRGRNLGLFNLTNTVPSLIMPSLTLVLVPTLGFSGLFAVLALLSAIAAILLRDTKRH